ncbi:MAG: SLC13 family permease [Sedimenticola sp.]|uniref:SLC13 family permease n=1 Tax=Sedimenticola thiotaurini TaxID=1543721 RepID=A0A558D0H2_9GAMM|nr:SLC13 family permease [Sedimenticola sp.]TVT54519.1 MAG: SLC13 family permease [Sedimenticola thiotaurini]MCW8921880.1 SLC13 family permease [Sedimenticola sp.]MCW8947416.1 SLC13 family permease [Sedimenticola sp.]MCW8976821.1 SLC13 family permease [Sedimenticola sp.]
MLPPLPDPHAIAVLLLIVVALILFTRDYIPLETSSLLILVTLVVGFQVFPYTRNGITLQPGDFFTGFGNEALVAICALMIVGQGLETTGALRPLATMLSKHWSNWPLLSFLITLLSAAILSAFLNNTPIVVMLLPILISVSIRNKQSSSEILMPMGLATLLGGMATTIGTSTNLLVVAIASDLGMRSFGMFDFALPVIVAGSAGLLYLWLIAPRLLPKRQALLSDTSPRVFDAVLYINSESFANGKTLAEVLEKTERRMKVDRIHRGEGLNVTRLPTAVLREGDRLLVRDTPELLKEYETLLGATLYNASDIENPIDEEHPLSSEGQLMAEVVVTEGSLLYRKTLKELRFAEHNNVVILAIHRSHSQANRTLRSGMGDVRLENGDVLLMQGAAERIKELKSSGKLLVLDASVYLPETSRARLALLIMAAVVAFAATGMLPIATSALCGVGLMLLTRCLDWEDAASALSTRVILIVVVSLALGLALMQTGGAEYIASLYVAVSTGLPISAILGGLMLLIALLTNVVSNNAAAVIGTPIAASIAAQLGLPPEPFVLAVLFGANMSYATPMGYQTNLLIYSAGGYKFSDFLRVGIPLTLIMWLGLLSMLIMMYDL